MMKINRSGSKIQLLNVTKLCLLKTLIQKLKKKKCAQRGSHTDTNTTQLITQQTEIEKF